MRIPLHPKHWLIPHRRNDHRPHLIRRHGLTAIAAAIVLIHGVAYVSQPMRPAHWSGNVLAYSSNITPVALFNETNQERAAAGLPALRLDARLNHSAALKAQNMFTEDYWAHVSPSGLQPWHWFGLAGYTYQYAGENLAKDFDTSPGVTEGWMNSPGHRANILNAHYTDVGFAVVNGTLLGGETTLVVAHYGAPVASAVAAAKPAAPTQPTAPKPVAVVPAAPVATPPPTPAATPTPVITPAPTPLPTAAPVKPVVVGEVTQAAPDPQSYSLIKPLALTRTLGWPTLSTVAILLVLWLVYLATHLTVWRRRLRRWRNPRYRHLALAQTGGVAILILYLITTGFGHVG